jgi:phosphatidylserine/phosphatidylglycerophosphate/cardiolipin synthase-like enzyme
MRRGMCWLSAGLSLVGGCGSRPLAGLVGTDGGPDAASPSVYTAAVQIVVEPSDDAAALVAAIAGAKSSVHMTMYLFDNASAIRALEAQRSAGRDVKIVLNQSFGDDGGSNARVFDELELAGIDVAWAPSAFALTHEKCVILDGKEAWIMTMNLDESSAKLNREYLAIDTDPADILEAETIFEADFTHTPATVRGRLVVSPVNSRAKLLGLIGAAKHTIDIEGEELSDVGVVSALTKAAGEGVNVKVVLSDESPSAAQTQAISLLRVARVPVVRVSHPYIHAKAIVVDGTAAYVGSENFSAASLDSNRELGLLFNDGTQVQKVDTTILADFALGTSR